MPAKIDQELAKELVATAHAVATPGKGILAADESTGTIGKRFEGIKVENTEENRAFYRGLLFTTKGLGQYISGAILFEETLYQKNPEGVPMVELMKAEGIIPGIKVDKGLVDMFGTNGEKSTQGLDGLAKRCQDYYQAGARFAKWRAVLNIDVTKPSMTSIRETAHTLARYAAICQENRLVPIVEPEILTDGSHDIQKTAYVTEVVLTEVFRALNEQNILLEGCLLKPNMVTQGSDCPTKASADEIGYMTVRTLQRTVPPALVGVMFLSGGQSEEEASLNLNAMNKLDAKRRPWVLSFSYGRALQASVLKAWAGNPANKEAAQATLMERAKANSEAQLGKYAGSTTGAGSESLFQANYAY